MSVVHSSPKSRFTGIFIPAEILEFEDLTLLEMMLISIIDSLYSSEHGGCHASNEYLGKRLRSQENTIAKSLTKLRGLGLIEDVSFDGRTRVIRALIHRYVDQTQSKAALDKNPRGVGQKSNPELGENPTGVPRVLIEDSKDDSKEREKAAPSPRTTSVPRRKNLIVPSETKTPYRSNVHLTEAEYQNHLARYGKEKLEWMLDYLEAKKGSKDYNYKSDFHVMLPPNWVNKAYEEQHQEKNAVSKSLEKEDRTLAEKIWNRWKGRTQQDMEMGYKYIEFKNGMTSEHLEFGSKDFRIKCMEQLRRRNLNTSGL